MDLRIGDCNEVLARMPAQSVDAIVTDPPYGLGFMGKQWDALPPGKPWAEQCLRVLKPGGHLIAFGGQRTIHRLTCAIEDGGFEIRDLIGWLQWQGFPKSLDVSKAIDAAAGATREIVGVRDKLDSYGPAAGNHVYGGGPDHGGRQTITAPATDDAKRWQGYGTALKPALEPATLARKPLDGTVAGNVLTHGTGALNIDGCRYAYGDAAWPGPSAEVEQVFGGRKGPEHGAKYGNSGYYFSRVSDLGRWPANIYACPKPSRGERDDGTDPTTAGYNAVGRRPGTAGLDNPRAGAGRTAEAVGNHHPTVKPVQLMRWLCRLVTPPGGIVCDPFMGSGTTGIAALAEGFEFIGIEREPEYVEIARARMLAEKERAGTLSSEDAANSNGRKQLGLFG